MIKYECVCENERKTIWAASPKAAARIFIKEEGYRPSQREVLRFDVFVGGRRGRWVFEVKVHRGRITAEDVSACWGCP